MSCLPRPNARRPAEAASLSGRVVGQLRTDEQLLLWALRRRLTDGGHTPPALVHGFRLAFGLALVEAALASFERLCALVDRHATRDLGLLPLTCPCVSLDEQRLVGLVTAAMHGETAARARSIVGEPHAEALAGEAGRLARLLARAALDPHAEAPSPAARH